MCVTYVVLRDGFPPAIEGDDGTATPAIAATMQTCVRQHAHMLALVQVGGAEAAAGGAAAHARAPWRRPSSPRWADEGRRARGHHARNSDNEEAAAATKPAQEEEEDDPWETPAERAAQRAELVNAPQDTTVAADPPCVAFLLGRLTTGTSVAVAVTGYTPWVRVRVPPRTHRAGVTVAAFAATLRAAAAGKKWQVVGVDAVRLAPMAGGWTCSATNAAATARDTMLEVRFARVGDAALAQSAWSAACAALPVTPEILPAGTTHATALRGRPPKPPADGTPVWTDDDGGQWWHPGVTDSATTWEQKFKMDCGASAAWVGHGHGVVPLSSPEVDDDVAVARAAATWQPRGTPADPSRRDDCVEQRWVRLHDAQLRSVAPPSPAMTTRAFAGAPPFSIAAVELQVEWRPPAWQPHMANDAQRRPCNIEGLPDVDTLADTVALGLDIESKSHDSLFTEVGKGDATVIVGCVFARPRIMVSSLARVCIVRCAPWVERHAATGGVFELTAHGVQHYVIAVPDAGALYDVSAEVQRVACVDWYIGYNNKGYDDAFMYDEHARLYAPPDARLAEGVVAWCRAALTSAVWATRTAARAAAADAATGSCDRQPPPPVDADLLAWFAAGTLRGSVQRAYAARYPALQAWAKTARMRGLAVWGAHPQYAPALAAAHGAVRTTQAGADARRAAWAAYFAAQKMGGGSAAQRALKPPGVDGVRGAGAALAGVAAVTQGAGMGFRAQQYVRDIMSSVWKRRRAAAAAEARMARPAVAAAAVRGWLHKYMPRLRLPASGPAGSAAALEAAARTPPAWMACRGSTNPSRHADAGGEVHLENAQQGNEEEEEDEEEEKDHTDVEPAAEDAAPEPTLSTEARAAAHDLLPTASASLSAAVVAAALARWRAAMTRKHEYDTAGADMLLEGRAAALRAHLIKAVPEAAPCVPRPNSAPASLLARARAAGFVLPPVDIPLARLLSFLPPAVASAWWTGTGKPSNNIVWTPEAPAGAVPPAPAGAHAVWAAPVRQTPPTGMCVGWFPTEPAVLAEVSVKSAGMADNAYAILTATGVVNFDLLQFLKQAGTQGSLKLAVQAAAILGHDADAQKLTDVSYSDISDAFAEPSDYYTPVNPALAAEGPLRDDVRVRAVVYCARDAELPLRIVAKKDIVGFSAEMARECNTPLGAVLAGGQQVRMYNNQARRVARVYACEPPGPSGWGSGTVRSPHDDTPLGDNDDDHSEDVSHTGATMGVRELRALCLYGQAAPDEDADNELQGGQGDEPPPPPPHQHGGAPSTNGWHSVSAPAALPHALVYEAATHSAAAGAASPSTQSNHSPGSAAAQLLLPLLPFKVRARTRLRAAETAFLATQKRTAGFDGAFVLNPRVGAYGKRVVIVLDFQALYPTITMSYNLCPSTLVTNRAALLAKLAATRNPGAYVDITVPLNMYAADGSVSVKDFTFAQHFVGVVPLLLMKVMHARLAAKAAKQEARQMALKLLANSSYGVRGATRGSMSCMPVAAAITTLARTYLHAACAIVQELHPNVDIIYGDTDSLFTAWPEDMPFEAAVAAAEAAAATVSKRLHAALEARMAATASHWAAVFDTDAASSAPWAAAYGRVRAQAVGADVEGPVYPFGGGVRGLTDALYGSGSQDPDADMVPLPRAMRVPQLCFFIKLALDHIFRQLLLLGKKQYAALEYVWNKERKEWDAHPLEKGVAVVRSDHCALEKQLMEDVLTHVRTAGLDDLPTLYGIVQRAVDAIVNNTVPLDRYVLAKKLAGQYDGFNMHAEAWKRMIARGDEDVPAQGCAMPFIVTATVDGVLQPQLRKIPKFLRTEHPAYVQRCGLAVDRAYYLNILKSSLLEVVLRKWVPQHVMDATTAIFDDALTRLSEEESAYLRGAAVRARAAAARDAVKRARVDDAVAHGDTPERAAAAAAASDATSLFVAAGRTRAPPWMLPPAL